MRKIKLIVTLLFAAFMAGCSNVPPGNVGVIVHLLGGDKGVDHEEVGVGRYWLGWNDQLFLFPTFTQNHVWTKSATEGSPSDDSFTFQTREGLNVNTDVGISYHIDPSKVGSVFQRYRKGVDEITNVVLRNSVRDAFNKEASIVDIESAYGSGKTKLVTDVFKRVSEDTAPVGIIVENIFLVGELRLPPQIVNAINAKTQATQMTQQRENEIQQTRNEAEKAIAAAHGEAESKLAVARAEAESVKMRGEAEATAIKAKSDALNASPQLVQYEIAHNWDGKLPSYTGGAIPLLNLPVNSK